jgi:predicted Zn-dependent protease
MNSLINQLIKRMGDRRGFQSLLRILELALLSAVVCACASVPHTGRRQFNIVSHQSINALGTKAFREVIQKEPETKDERLKAIVKQAATRVSRAAEEIDKPKFDWEVRVIDRDEPNAFCLPGGKIVVNSGIARYAKNEAGLAAIIAHEVAHATALHGSERLSQKLVLDGALNVGAQTLMNEDGSLTQKARLLLGALGLGGMVGVILPYSRVHEFEADRIGQIYMAKAGYDPAEAVRVWDRMSRIKKPPIPVWLSTHPADQERVQKLREFLPDARRYYESATEKHGLGSVL